MKSFLGLLCFCLLAIRATAFHGKLLAADVFAREDTATGNAPISPDAVSNATSLPLPQCGQRCFAQVLPQYDCDVDDVTCICPNANLTSALQACSFSNCTIPNQLLVERFSKNSCGVSSRDDSTRTQIVTWVLFALAIFFIICRFVARPQKMKGSGYGTDDWTILSCILLLIPFNVLIQSMTDNGLGMDNYTLPASDITTMLKEFYVFEILYTILVMITKVSILQLYLRIWTVEAVSRWFRRTCWICIVVLILTMLAFVFSLIFQCTPVHFAWLYWDGLHNPGHCVNRPAQIYVLGAFNIAYDVIVFVLPLHHFLKLNISWRRKFGVCLIFMVGMLVTICSIVRLQYLVKIGRSTNQTWDYNSAVIWSSVECNLAVVCTCMPAMAGLIQRLWAAMTGKPLSTSASESKAPIHPTVIDPENPVNEDEILHMREASSLADSATEVNESDHDAPTTKIYRSQQLAATQNGIEIRHEPPSQTTATKMSYRDHEGRLHEVKVIDKPTDDKDPNWKKHEHYQPDNERDE